MFMRIMSMRLQTWCCTGDLHPDLLCHHPDGSQMMSSQPCSSFLSWTQHLEGSDKRAYFQNHCTLDLITFGFWYQPSFLGICGTGQLRGQARTAEQHVITSTRHQANKTTVSMLWNAQWGSLQHRQCIQLTVHAYPTL
jgi:hypothetical protein